MILVIYDLYLKISTKVKVKCPHLVTAIGEEERTGGR